MSNNKTIIAFIKSISGQANVLTIPRVYIDIIGKDRSAHKEALILSQSVYWSDRSDYPDGWFRKTYKEWHEELGIHHDSIDRLVDRLIKLDLMETKIAVNNDKFYRPKLDVLVALIDEFYSDPSTHDAYTPLPVMRMSSLDIDSTEIAAQNAASSLDQYFPRQEIVIVNPKAPQDKESREARITAALQRHADGQKSLTETIREISGKEVSSNNKNQQAQITDLREWGATANTLHQCAAYCQRTLNADNWRKEYKPSLKDIWENYRASQAAPAAKETIPASLKGKKVYQ